MTCVAPRGRAATEGWAGGLSPIILLMRGRGEVPHGELKEEGECDGH